MKLIQRAKFIGEDGSLGYRHGQVYELYVYPTGPKYAITIQRRDGSGTCPYTSVKAWRRNWEPIEDEPEVDWVTGNQTRSFGPRGD